VEAASSSLLGTDEKPSLAEVIKKGTLTNAMASPIANGEPTSVNPAFDATPPSRESLEINPRIAIPAAEWGITTGISIMASTTPLKGNLFLARMYARGIAKKETIRVADADIKSVLHILEVTSLSVIVSKSSGDFTERNIPASGAIIKSRTTPPRNIKIKRVLL
jgi:hypothetical protein